MAITPLPAAPSRQSPSDFSVKADAFIAALPTFITEANAQAAALELNSTTANSTTSLAIGTGAKSLTVDVSKSYQPGMSVKIARTADPVNWMHGDVVSYNAGTGALVASVTAIQGTGTFTDWTITFSAPVSSAVPAGAEMFWPNETPPVGWMAEEGASLLRASYPALFAVIGTMYGAADGTHFNLPDMRGKFPRIWDHAAGVDPDAATRTAPAATGATLTAGDHVGTEQADAFELHTHTGTVGTTLNGSVSTGVGGAIIGVQSNGLTQAIGSTGGNETRPVNAYRMMIIRVY